MGAMLCAAHMPRLLQKVLDNRLMRFLSAISMNLYIWHQILSVQMRVAWFPDANTLHITPVQQRAYSLLCFSVSHTCGDGRHLWAGTARGQGGQRLDQTIGKEAKP